VRKLGPMLSICYDFGVCCDLSFNTDKSFCGLVGRLFGDIFPTFVMGGRSIPRTENLVYLGVTFKLGSIDKREQLFKVKVFYFVLDRAHAQINQRFMGMHNATNCFGVLEPKNIVREPDLIIRYIGLVQADGVKSKK
jgi:hypothetical protein